MPPPGFSPFLRLDLRRNTFDSPCRLRCACFPRSIKAFDEGSYRSRRVFRRGCRAYRLLDVLLVDDSLCVARDASPSVSSSVRPSVGGLRLLVRAAFRGAGGSSIELSDVLCFRRCLFLSTTLVWSVQRKGLTLGCLSTFGEGSGCTVSSSHRRMSMVDMKRRNLVFSRPAIRAAYERAVPPTAPGLPT